MKSLKKAIATLLIFGAAAMPVTALAQDQSPVTLKGDVMAIETSVDENGNEITKLVEPALIVPGDRLMLAVEYSNGGSEPADNFVITNVVPAAVRFASDAPADLIVSVDGGTKWGTLDSLTIAEADGTERAAKPDDVTHVRWTLASIAPGDAGRVEYPAVIR